jgi:hypothetical protein
VSDPQGIVTYPGLANFTKAEYVLSQGISPGKCTIELPQELVDGLEATGDLTITYADQTITLPNCLLDSAHIDQSEKGYIARVTILDRRWQWKFGYISGHYNVRMPGGANANEGFNSSASNSQNGGNSTKIRPGTEQAPQDLASLCLQAMGEQNYDVSALPNQPRPEIDWSWHNPAEALQQLCEGLGCRVTYVIDSDSVAVVTVGQGNSLPDNGLQTFVSAGVNPPNTPSSLKLVGGPAVYQGFIPLEAVGIDKDGSIKPIDDLTYTPPKGWANENPDKFPNITDPNVRPLLEKSVYKMWRVALPIQVPNPPAGNANVITSINQIHLFDRLIDTNWDPSDQGKTTPKKPEIWGNFYQQYAQAVQTPSTTPQVYKHGLEVDADRMLIITEDKLYSMGASGIVEGAIIPLGSNYAPANIQVKIAYSIRHNDTWEFYRFTQSMDLGSTLQTQPQIVHREEIFTKTVGQFDPNFQLIGFTDNAQSDSLQDEANYYLQAAAQEYIEQDSFDVPYAGIVPIQVDGLIQQVTYTIHSGPGGSTMTRASLATEHNPYVLPWGARRRAEKERADRAGQTPSGRHAANKLINSFVGYLWHA